MTNQNHPITPPQWQVDAWYKQAFAMGADVDAVFLEAARWGADQQLKLNADRIAQAYQAGADHELEACEKWVASHFDGMFVWSATLRTARRPQLPPETLEVDGHTYRLVK